MDIIKRKLPIIFMMLITMSCSRSNDTSESTDSDSLITREQDHSVNSQYETPLKLKEYVVGSWQAQSNQQKGSGKINPGDNIVFTFDGKYISYLNNQKVDSGTYRVNEQHLFLYLQSAGSTTPKEWKVISPSTEKMTLEPANQNSNAVQRIEYNRTR